MNRKVSIIIPNYNHGKYIGECIKSVIMQTYADIEIIVIDNFSQDNTQQVVNEIKRENPSINIIFLRFDNKGIIAASRNLGVRYATGTYLAFLDSDDVWEPEKLKIQIEYLINSDYSAIATRFKPVGDIKNFFDHLDYMEDKDSEIVSFKSILLSNSIVTSSIIIRKDYFMHLEGFDESQEYRFIEDWELWIRLSYNFGSIKILNEKLVNYRVYDTKGRDLSDDAKRCLQVLDKYYDKGYMGNDLYRRSRSNAYINYVGKCIQSCKSYERLTLLRSFLYSKNSREKFRGLVFVILSFVPLSHRVFVRNILYTMMKRINF